MSFGTISSNLPLFYCALNNVPCETTLSSLGSKQLEEMVVPRDVEKEDNHTLVEEGKAFAAELNAKLESLKISDSQLQELAREIEAFDFQNAPATSNLLDDNLPYLAAQALRKGFLDPVHGPKQVATILNFWGALQCHLKDKNGLQTIPLFLSGITNPLAESLIRQTLDAKNIATNTPSIPFLEGEKLITFMNKMRELPLSEQRFLLVHDIQVRNNWNAPALTISQILNTSLVNVFSRVHHNRQPMRVIPSLGMMQAFLEAQYDEPVTIKPRLYLSTEMQIRECGLKGCRDILMPFPDANGENRSPSTADESQAPWYDFPYHDFYHAIVASATGETYRKVGVLAFDAIADFVETSRGAQEFRPLAASFIDMEYTHFLHFVNQPPRPYSQLFWEIVNDKFITHVLKNNPHHPPGALSIPASNTLDVLQHVYNWFVIQNKGPSELDKKSFEDIVQFKKATRNERVAFATARDVDKIIQELQQQNLPLFLMSPTIVQAIKTEIEISYDNQPILLLEETLNNLQ